MKHCANNKFFVQSKLLRSKFHNVAVIGLSLVYLILYFTVKPDTVDISRINQTSVKLQYPHSWSTPSSYFPLIFQVKEIRCQNRKKCDCSKPSSAEVRSVLTARSDNLCITKC